jgi:hypothetical protein
MVHSVDQFTKVVPMLLGDGSRVSVELDCAEKEDQGETIYRIELEFAGRRIIGASEFGYFTALQRVRSECEKEEAFLLCLGASEDVYPSGMQMSMGPASLAYRMRIGRQALSSDIVKIFDSDESVKPSTVEQQELFRKRWLESLR